MTKKNRLLSVLLALALLLGTAALPASAEARTTAAQGAALSTLEKANALHELGLLDGTGTNADGTPDYDLDGTVNRSQGSTMFVYLLGKRTKAAAQYTAGAVSSPFKDLSWDAPYVTWLYANGLVDGKGPTTYAGNDEMEAYEFATLILRALGYGDDFHYTQSMAFAVQKNVITEAQRKAFEASFRRDGLVEMCYNAMYLKIKDSSLTLLEKLTNDGIFKDSYKNNTSVAGTRAMTLTEKYKGGGTYNPTYMEDDILSNALCEDIDGDGNLEIIFGVRTIFCVNAADGKLKWRIADSQTGGQALDVRAPFQILDWDGDGEKEIFAMTFADPKGTVNIIDASGKIKASWTVNAGNYGHNIRAGYPADLDRDGKYELIIGLGVGEDGMRGTPAVYVYNNDGSLRSGWPQTQDYGLFSNSITAADLDGDGKLEIVLTYDDTHIVAFHADGTRVEAPAIAPGVTWDKITFFANEDRAGYNPNSLTTIETRNGIMGTKSGLIVDDLDGNGTQEIIGVSLIANIRIVADNMASGQGVSFLDNGQYIAPFIINLDRTRYVNRARGFDWSSIPTDTGDILALSGDNFRNPGAKIDISDPDCRPVTADVDGDGIKEILYTASDGLVHCFSLDGTEHGAWPFSLNSRTTSVISFASRPVAADLNGDGKMEVIFATYTPRGQTAVRGKLYVLDYTGKKLAEVTLPPTFYTNVDATYANGSQATPIVADIDGDNKLEIVVATYNCGLVAYEIN